jgi:hypothetical protein
MVRVYTSSVAAEVVYGKIWADQSIIVFINPTVR